MKKGNWILLDEINLAAAETLECLSGLLEGSAGSLLLLDRGDTGKKSVAISEPFITFSNLAVKSFFFFFKLLLLF